MGVNLRAARLSADQVETPERSREPWSRQKAGQVGVLWSEGPRSSPGVAVPKPSRAGGHSGSGSWPQSPAPRLRLGQRGGGKGRTRTARRDRRGRGRGGAAHALRAGTLRAARGERRCVQWRGAWGVGQVCEPEAGTVPTSARCSHPSLGASVEGCGVPSASGRNGCWTCWERDGGRGNGRRVTAGCGACGLLIPGSGLDLQDSGGAF